MFLSCDSKSQNHARIVTHLTEYTTTDLKIIKLNTEPKENESYVRE